MNRNSADKEKKLDKQRQLEGNRRPTNNTSTTNHSLAKNKPLSNELMTVLEPQQVGNFDEILTVQSIKCDSKVEHYAWFQSKDI